MVTLIDKPQTDVTTQTIVEEYIEFIPEKGAFTITPAGSLRYLHRSVKPNDTATPSGTVYRDLIRAIDNLELRVCDGIADLAENAEIYIAAEDYNRFIETANEDYLKACSERLSYLPS